MICKQCKGSIVARHLRYTLYQGPACFYFCGEAHADEWAAARLRSFSGGPHKHAHAATGHAVDGLRDVSCSAVPVSEDAKLPPAALLS